MSNRTVPFIFNGSGNHCHIVPYLFSLYALGSLSNCGVPFFFIYCGNHSPIVPHLFFFFVAKILVKSWSPFFFSLPRALKTVKSYRTFLLLYIGTGNHCQILLFCAGPFIIVLYLSSLFFAGSLSNRTLFYIRRGNHCQNATHSFLKKIIEMLFCFFINLLFTSVLDNREVAILFF